MPSKANLRSKVRPTSFPEPRVCIVQPNRSAPSETFIAAQADRLPTSTTVLYGKRPYPLEFQASDRRRYLRLRTQRILRRTSPDWEFTRHAVELFEQINPTVVLAQFGPTGARILDACRALSIPLIVNFRGADASDRELLKKHARDYARLFDHAAALVAVSHSIESKLLSLGAPRERLFWNPSGADCEMFSGGNPSNMPPVILSVGRFVEKKAPHLVIMAFAAISRVFPEAKLRMVGDGPLLSFCKELVHQLGKDTSVSFLGCQPHQRVAEEMRKARVYAQHSVVARSGDSEGTPVSVMEASATGLPVVATRHAGIVDVVQEGRSGILVDEGDFGAMSDAICQFLHSPQLAERMGDAGRQIIQREFSQQQSINRIWSIIQRCARDSGRSANDCLGEQAALVA